MITLALWCSAMYCIRSKGERRQWRAAQAGTGSSTCSGHDCHLPHTLGLSSRSPAGLSVGRPMEVTGRLGRGGALAGEEQQRGATGGVVRGGESVREGRGDCGAMIEDGARRAFEGNGRNAAIAERLFSGGSGACRSVRLPPADASAAAAVQVPGMCSPSRGPRRLRRRRGPAAPKSRRRVWRAATAASPLPPCERALHAHALSSPADCPLSLPSPLPGVR